MGGALHYLTTDFQLGVYSFKVSDNFVSFLIIIHMCL